MLKVSDPFIIMHANRLGYEILSDDDQNAWHRKNSKLIGPFSSLEEAAKSAIDEHLISTAEEILKNEGESK